MIEKSDNKKSTKDNNFCLFADYDAYEYDFWKYGIDLETDNINFFKFISRLNMFLEDETSAVNKRIQFRTYKPSKSDNKQYKAYMNRMKNKYKL